MPTVDTSCMQAALENFVKYIDPNDQKIIILVVDNAGWHISKKLSLPKNLLIICQPAYTPELSPVEPMVKNLKIPLANRLFKDLDDMQNVLIEECKRIKASPEEVKSQTQFPWIKNVIKSF